MSFFRAASTTTTTTTAVPNFLQRIRQTTPTALVTQTTTKAPQQTTTELITSIITKIVKVRVPAKQAVAQEMAATTTKLVTAAPMMETTTRLATSAPATTTAATSVVTSTLAQTTTKLATSVTKTSSSVAATTQTALETLKTSLRKTTTSAADPKVSKDLLSPFRKMMPTTTTTPIPAATRALSADAVCLYKTLLGALVVILLLIGAYLYYVKTRPYRGYKPVPIDENPEDYDMTPAQSPSAIRRGNERPDTLIRN